MNTAFQLMVSVLATIFSLLSMIAGIMLANTAVLTFWQMIVYDLVFILQFLTFLWCAVIYVRKNNDAD